MMKSLKIALRKISRHKFFALLNIFGLSLAFACGLLLFQFINYHRSFEKHNGKAQRLDRIVTELDFGDGKYVYEKGAPLPAGAEMQQLLPLVKGHAELLNVHTGTVEITTAQGKKLFAENENISFTSPQFFNLFDYRFLSGEASALGRPNIVALTKTTAEKYFGVGDVIGKTITLDGHLLTVAAVIADPPATTDIKTALFVSRATFNNFYPGQEDQMMHDWGYINSTTQSFVLLANAADSRDAERGLAKMKNSHFDASVINAYHFHLQPLTDMHFDTHYGAGMQRGMLDILSIIAIFIVLIACFNFINFATAQSLTRAKEIGTRKVLGGTPKSIFWQFITETTMLVTAACLLAFLWMLLARPFLNSWLQIHLSLNIFSDGRLALVIAALFVCIVLASGFYPAFVMSRFKPLQALKNNVAGKSAGIFRSGLIVLQNLIVQALIICVVLIAQQVSYLKSANLGFNKDGVMLVPVPVANKSQMNELKLRLQAQPKIADVSFCWQAPSSESGLGGSVKIDTRDWENFTCKAMAADNNYLKTFKLQLIAGTNFQQSDTVKEFVINELLAHKLGIKNAALAIGHRLTAGNFDNHDGVIVGVVKDFNTSSLYKPMDPVFITTSLDYYKYAAIKLNSVSAEEIDAIRKAWSAVYPSNVFEYHFVDEQIDNFYHKEDLLNKLIDAATIIAILISCLGLLGLISFSIGQRTKEIGIRKVLGAPVSSIVYLLFKNFLKLLVLSAVISVPLALYTINQWLQNFAYRMQIGWWVFEFAIVVSVGIAFITTVIQSVKAALKNPVESLKVE